MLNIPDAVSFFLRVTHELPSLEIANHFNGIDIKRAYPQIYPREIGVLVEKKRQKASRNFQIMM